MQTNNPVCETFASILLNISNYENLLKNTFNIFNDTINNIDNKNLLSIDFINEYKQYPKYKADFKPIDSLDKYNLVSIYNIVQDDVKYL